MFWKKKKKAEIPQASESTALSAAVTTACHAKYANLALRRSILDWRDRHTENAELHLSRELSTLYSSLDEQLEKMSVRDLFTSKSYGAEHFEPIFTSWIEREATHIISAAQNDLASAFSRSLEMGQLADSLDHQEGKEHYTDVAIAAAATGAGLAAIPAVATMSIVSTGGVLGFLGATVAAWPVVALGVVAVGGLLALGGYKAADLKTSAIARFRKSMRNAIKEQVLGSDVGNPSICERIQRYIDATAEEILLEIDE